VAKPFSWSFSRLKNFETCAFRHLKCDLTKPADGGYKESSEQLDWGNKVHAALANALLQNTAAGLPPDMAVWSKWIGKLGAMPGQLLVEKKYALTRSFEPCEYFGSGVWCRVVVDILRLNGPVAFVGDWKTGGMKHNADQLVIGAQAVFSNFPAVQKITSAFIWLKDGVPSKEVFTRKTVADAWKNGLLQRVNKMEDAAKHQMYPKQPGGLCRRYCPVEICEFHGVGSR
jgi:hypothetical protein